MVNDKTPLAQPKHADSQSVPVMRMRTVSKATLAILPLSIAVIPWGILCGTLSIEAGLTAMQAQLMSLLVFAGASQLAGIALFGAGGSWLALLNSTSMIGVRHVLYSASYQAHVRHLPLVKRLLFAFLLTDEMFAVAQADQLKTGRFDYWYGVIAGFGFYLTWNISTFIGIYTAHLLGNVEEMGFDFAIAAIFIAMVIPMLFKTKPIKIKPIKTKLVKSKLDKTPSIPNASATNEQKSSVKEEAATRKKLYSPVLYLPILYLPMLMAVLVSTLVALTCAYFEVSQGLIVSTLAGMVTGALLVNYSDKVKDNGVNVI